NTLRRQAAKARRYQRLVDDLREKRLALLRLRLAAADGDRRDTGDALEALRDQEVAGTASIASDEAELERLRLLLEEGETAARRGAGGGARRARAADRNDCRDDAPQRLARGADARGALGPRETRARGGGPPRRPGERGGGCCGAGAGSGGRTGARAGPGAGAR